MSPTIRIDDQVMHELKRQAYHLGLVFRSPNEVLRVVLKLDDSIDDGGHTRVMGSDSGQVQTSKPSSPESARSVVIEFPSIEYRRRYRLIDFPAELRPFFPGFRRPFSLETDCGMFTLHVTSAPKGTPIGNPDAGKYLVGGLRNWYDHHKELADGAKINIEAIEPGKHYRLSIMSKGR